MDLSNFDPQAFLSMSMDQPFEKRANLPTDATYPGDIKDVKVRPWRSQDKTDEAGAQLQGIALDVEVELAIPADIQTRLGIKLPTFRLTHGFILDMTPQGSIDYAPGKNRALREYREATDSNRPGQSFSPLMLMGKRVSYRIRHEEYPKGSGNLVEKIAGVAGKA